MEQRRKVWENPEVKNLSIKNVTLSGPAKGQPEGSVPGEGKGLGNGGPTAGS